MLNAADGRNCPCFLHQFLENHGFIKARFIKTTDMDEGQLRIFSLRISRTLGTQVHGNSPLFSRAFLFFQAFSSKTS